MTDAYLIYLLHPVSDTTPIRWSSTGMPREACISGTWSIESEWEILIITGLKLQVHLGLGREGVLAVSCQ